MATEKSGETATLAGLTLLITILSVIGVRTGVTSPLEAVSVVTGAICVWLTVRENVWNFPIGLANVATFCVVFFHARLFADAGLQVVYFVLTGIGWYLWLYGGERGGELRVSRVGRTEAGIVSVSGLAAMGVLWLVLRDAKDSAPFLDALTTSLSLCAQWLLNRKYVENWYVWIAADLVYVPLYAWKGLYLTAGLYAVFLVMATLGLLHWRDTWRAERTPAPHPGPVEVHA